ncbi:sugar phosphate isomerase/epimerase [Caldibacillus lycopersici]|uniref:Sugar phosphate isomerase/epimerase n=1 Tax=Perspicuibacillus lycopersici TaxID=1325689 RepID=A0AAE3IUI5_9BACI|nr:sugar phosphate isomerase/epimerase family protein [Perspicuibacillus lycopersici]MCU9614843.1 sugar phosphate isomerase/epimerase [Perspicuibacillus lycopersici]
MKLAFTTLGCPTWDIDKIIKNAVENDYDGVDFRGYLGELDIFTLPEFSSEVQQTVRKFQEASLEIPCFSSSVRLFTNTEEEFHRYLQEIEAYANLCQAFQTPFIRVFGGSIGEMSREKAYDIVEHNVLEYLKIAEKYDVQLLFETHDDWTNCEHMKEIFQRVQSNYFSVLWDVHHPYRTIGEDPNVTWEKLGSWIKYTHWKDSYVKEGTPRGYQLCLLGEGTVPLQEIYKMLKTKGYDGYYTLEWEKMWCPEIEEPEIAFQQYSSFMKNLFK